MFVPEKPELIVRPWTWFAGCSTMVVLTALKLETSEGGEADITKMC